MRRLRRRWRDASVDNAQAASKQGAGGTAFPWRLPRLLLIGDGFTDPECADRIIVAAEAASGPVFRGVSDEAASGPVSEKNHSQTLWVHLRDRAAPDRLFRESATRLVERLRKVSSSMLISVNGRPEAAEALGCGYHAGTHDPAPGFSGDSRQPYGRSAHNLQEARAAMGGDRQNRDPGSAIGINPCAIGSHSREREAHPPQYFFFSPVFSPQGKPGYAGAGVDALRDFAHHVQGRLPVYALGGVTPERIGPCLAAGSYGVAVLSGIMQADRPGEAARAYVDALRACLGCP